MYRRTQDLQDYLGRVGSHSTKGRRNGALSVLPPEAKPFEHEYQSFKECVEVLSTEVTALQRKLETDKREHLKSRYGHLVRLLWEAKRAARLAGLVAYSETFYHVSKLIMPPEVLDRCILETNSVIGRHVYEYRHPGKGKGSKEAKRRKFKLQQRRKRLRQHMAKQGLTLPEQDSGEQ